MKEVFVKKHWPEDNILFYIHFQDGKAVRQIEVSPNGKKHLSVENPTDGDSMLYDQGFETLDLEEKDLISKEEFEKSWK
jgi:hypothetical protein